MVDFDALDTERLRSMVEAGDTVIECHRVLAKTNDNITGEVLRDQGTFYEYNHYPEGDVYDAHSHAQYYYHAHREGEHGHFHTFLRQAGMEKRVRPVEQSHADYMDERNDNLSHLIAISMDNLGIPFGLFTTNRWVTAENWYASADTCAMLERFEIDHVRPSWPVNLWITAMLALFRPQIVDLLNERDAAVAAWRRQHPDVDVFEDRGLEVTSACDISVDDQVRAVQSAFESRG